MQNNKKQLKKLIAEWDKKLKESGFQDVEDRKTGLLKKCGGDELWEPNSFNNFGVSWQEQEERTLKNIKFSGKGYSTFVWKQSQAEYYRLASIMCHDGVFKTDQEKTIWVLHAEGFSYRQIAKKTKLTVRKVWYSIQNTGKRFGLIKDDS
jgi:hypothetical protein